MNIYLHLGCCLLGAQLRAWSCYQPPTHITGPGFQFLTLLSSYDWMTSLLFGLPESSFRNGSSKWEVSFFRFIFTEILLGLFSLQKKKKLTKHFIHFSYYNYLKYWSKLLSLSLLEILVSYNF